MKACSGKFPGLKIVLMESGVSWLPAFMWRANKTWRGVRVEVPWVEREPASIIRDHVRVTMQPFDGPPMRPGLPMSSIRSARMRCSCSPRIIRIGNSRATIRYRRICRKASLRACARTIRLKPFRGSSCNHKSRRRDDPRRIAMSDVIDRPILEKEATANSRLRIIDCDVHPSLRCALGPLSVLSRRLAGAFEDLRRSLTHALYRHHALSAIIAPDRAPRRVASDRWTTGV